MPKLSRKKNQKGKLSRKKHQKGGNRFNQNLMLPKSDTDIETEFNGLKNYYDLDPLPQQFEITVALEDKNKIKNRYNDILPYDSNRVKLNDPNKYINVYIDNINKKDR